MNKIIASLAFTVLLVLMTNCRNNEDSPTPLLADAAFSIDKTIGSTGEEFVFTNTSQNYSSCVWNFGDGDTTCAVNPLHAYKTEGPFTIKLMVMGNGITKEFQKSVAVLTPNNRWAKLYLTNLTSIDSLYQSHAFVLAPNGQIYKGLKQIKAYYAGIKSSLQDISGVKTIYAKDDMSTSLVKYEIGTFNTSDNACYKYFIIWSKEGELYKREFEILAKVEGVGANVTELELRRVEWGKRANAHNVANLMSSLYQPNACYYYNSANTLAEGPASIASELSYMGGSGFVAPRLTPYHCEVVNDNLIFEVGQWYYSDNKGDYIFIWTKGADGTWKILLDSDY